MQNLLFWNQLSSVGIDFEKVYTLHNVCMLHTQYIQCICYCMYCSLARSCSKTISQVMEVFQYINGPFILIKRISNADPAVLE